MCSVSFMTRMVFLNFQDIVVAPYFHVIGKKCTHTKKIHMALSKDFRKVSKRGKCLFFGFLENISSKNENRWDVHPYLRLHYIITKKRRIFYEWLTIHLGFLWLDFDHCQYVVKHLLSFTLLFSWSFRHPWSTFIFVHRFLLKLHLLNYPAFFQYQKNDLLGHALLCVLFPLTSVLAFRYQACYPVTSLPFVFKWKMYTAYLAHCISMES